MDHKEKTFAYFGIATAMCVLWIFTIPIWDSFMSGVMNIGDYEKVIGLVLILLPFYILYSYNTLMDSVFYGKGRTELLAYQSIITNVSVYGTAFLLFQADVFSPTLTSIALLFGTGIAVDSIVTFTMYRKSTERCLWHDLMFSPIDSDKLQGVIRNPFAFYFNQNTKGIQWADTDATLCFVTISRCRR